jgi:hypothetical protein
MELAPFIIGVGKILTNETPEGFVVLVAGKNRDEIAHVDGHLHGEVKKSATRTFASACKWYKTDSPWWPYHPVVVKTSTTKLRELIGARRSSLTEAR